MTAIFDKESVNFYKTGDYPKPLDYKNKILETDEKGLGVDQSNNGYSFNIGGTDYVLRSKKPNVWALEENRKGLITYPLKTPITFNIDDLKQVYVIDVDRDGDKDLLLVGGLLTYEVMNDATYDPANTMNEEERRKCLSADAPIARITSLTKEEYIETGSVQETHGQNGMWAYFMENPNYCPDEKLAYEVASNKESSPLFRIDAAKHISRAGIKRELALEILKCTDAGPAAFEKGIALLKSLRHDPKEVLDLLNSTNNWYLKATKDNIDEILNPYAHDGSFSKEEVESFYRKILTDDAVVSRLKFDIAVRLGDEKMIYHIIYNKPEGWGWLADNDTLFNAAKKLTDYGMRQASYDRLVDYADLNRGFLAKVQLIDDPATRDRHLMKRLKDDPKMQKNQADEIKAFITDRSLLASLASKSEPEKPAKKVEVKQPNLYDSAIDPNKYIESRINDLRAIPEKSLREATVLTIMDDPKTSLGNKAKMLYELRILRREDEEFIVEQLQRIANMPLTNETALSILTANVLLEDDVTLEKNVEEVVGSNAFNEDVKWASITWLKNKEQRRKMYRIIAEDPSIRFNNRLAAAYNTEDTDVLKKVCAEAIDTKSSADDIDKHTCRSALLRTTVN